MEIIKKYTILRRLMMLFAVVAIGVSMTSCSDDDDEQGGGAGGDLSTGYWFYEDNYSNIELYFSNKKACVGEFYSEDGKYVIDGLIKRSCEFDGEYTLSGGNVKIVIEECTDSRECPEFKAGTVLTGTIDGDKLMMKIDGQTYCFKRDLDYDYDDWMNYLK